MEKRTSKHFELTPAVGYLRKSTKGKRPDGRERQEKSIGQQKTEIKKLAKRLGYRIVAWYSDEGISGWKTGHERPSYDRLLQDAESNGNFTAVFVDNLDRLSRATPFKVAADLNRLTEAGVADIFCANGDRYHIQDEHNYGEVFRIVAVLMGNAEYSRQLGRRVAIAHRNNAMQGRITGGFPPYGMRRDGDHFGPGPEREVQVVRWIFEWFANELCSANEIANRLNLKRIPASHGGKWCRQSVFEVLDRQTYAGTLTWNARSQGRFWYTEDGEVKDVSSRTKTSGNGLIRKEHVHEPIIDLSLWQRASQRRQLNKTQQRKPRSTTTSLCRILVCGHCGEYMHSFRKRGHTYYRCDSPGRFGKDACGYYSVAESKLLSRLMGPLGEEVNKLLELRRNDGAVQGTTKPTSKKSRRLAMAKEIASLDKRIDAGAARLLECNASVRSALDAQLTKLIEQRDVLRARLTENKDDSRDEQALFADDLSHLQSWWSDFLEQAEVQPGRRRYGGDEEWLAKKSFIEGLGEEPQSSGAWYSSSTVNETLHVLGVSVELHWRREERNNKRARNVLLPLRFQMGQSNLQEMSEAS